MSKNSSKKSSSQKKSSNDCGPDDNGGKGYSDNGGKGYGDSWSCLEDLLQNYFDWNGCKPTTPPAPHAGTNLFLDNFNAYALPEQYVAVSLAPTWVTAPGSAATEIVKEGYGDTVGGDGGYWLDTQGSPGGIDISTVVADANAGSARISLSLAVPFNGSYSAGTLQVFWNGAQHDINIADFSGANAFQTFEWVVNSAVTNTLQIKDTGVGFVGLALDSVRIDDWIS